MPRNTLTNDEFKVTVMKLKDELSYDPHGDCQHMANNYLNKVLDIIDEYRGGL